MRTIFLIAMILLLTQNLALASGLVPATSEDLNDFDRQISASQAMDSGKRDSSRGSARKDNFGAKVSVEAKKHKGSGDQRQGFGKWVSEQRQENDRVRPDNSGPGNNSGSGNDARNSAPSNNNSGSGSGSGSNSGKNK